MPVRLIKDICPRIIYNSEIYKLTKDEHCHYCNELNNLVHIIFSCSYIHVQRLAFLKCICYKNYTTDAFIILNLLNDSNVKKFAFFINECISSQIKTNAL